MSQIRSNGARCSKFPERNERRHVAGRRPPPTRQPRRWRRFSPNPQCRNAFKVFIARTATYDVAHRNLYDVHQRVASCYRDGRLVVAGDAAHINNPLGGMGMNFGIHDAFNLAERLSEIIHDGAGEDRLDLYDRQRRTVAQEYLQTQTIENKNNIEQKDEAAREAFYDRLRAINADPDALRAYLRRVTMIEGAERAASIV